MLLADQADKSGTWQNLVVFSPEGLSSCVCCNSCQPVSPWWLTEVRMSISPCSQPCDPSFVGTVSWDSRLLDVQDAVLHSSSLLVLSLKLPYGKGSRSAPSLIFTMCGAYLTHPLHKEGTHPSCLLQLPVCTAGFVLALAIPCLF